MFFWESTPQEGVKKPKQTKPKRSVATHINPHCGPRDAISSAMCLFARGLGIGSTVESNKMQGSSGTRGLWLGTSCCAAECQNCESTLEQKRKCLQVHCTSENVWFDVTLQCPGHLPFTVCLPPFRHPTRARRVKYCDVLGEIRSYNCYIW